MANKTVQKKKITEEVTFEIDNNVFKGPFTCHNRKTIKKNKKMSTKGFEFTYEVWLCLNCKKEFLDSEQSKQIEMIWTIEKILDDKLITLERNLNFDGKTFFVRFPIEITKKWNKGLHADIKILGPEEFLIKIKN